MPKKGYKQTDEHKAKYKNRRSGMLGKHHTEATRQKMKLHSAHARKGVVVLRETKDKLRLSHLGKHHSKETREKLSIASSKRVGSAAANWKGGCSRGYHPPEFNTQLKTFIKNRDNYRCRICFLHQSELQHYVHVHHSDYNEYNSDPINLFSLCLSCHSVTNANREYWTKYFGTLQN